MIDHIIRNLRADNDRSDESKILEDPQQKYFLK